MPESAKEKIRLASLGRRHTPESRLKMSLARKGQNFHTGTHWSEERKRKFSEAQRGPLNRNWGKTPWNKGMVGFLGGTSSPHWRGGLTPTVMLIRHSLKYKEWRSAVLTRDDYICQLCGVRGGKLQVDHHPRSFAQVVHENAISSIEQALECAALWNVANGRALCRPCHKTTDTYLKKFHR